MTIRTVDTAWTAARTLFAFCSFRRSSRAYVYQIYAYLRSQEGTGDPLAMHAAGLLLHPSIGEMVDETVVIKGHAIRFATVDLGAQASEIRKQLIQIVEFPNESRPVLLPRTV